MARRHYYSVTAEVDVSLGEFDLEDIADYLSENGYYVEKKEEVADRTRYPQEVRDWPTYYQEFCKLNGLGFAASPSSLEGDKK
jgi:hypothetical protein